MLEQLCSGLPLTPLPENNGPTQNIGNKSFQLFFKIDAQKG
jgi:hypothetical protein